MLNASVHGAVTTEEMSRMRVVRVLQCHVCYASDASRCRSSHDADCRAVDRLAGVLTAVVVHTRRVIRFWESPHRGAFPVLQADSRLQGEREGHRERESEGHREGGEEEHRAEDLACLGRILVLLVII